MSRSSNSGLPVPTAFPRNPTYGNGSYRRRIRLVREPLAMLALLDDTNHAMWCRVRHDGEQVVSVEGGMVRAPNSNCPGAVAALRELVGQPLSISRAELFGGGISFRNCTHLFDLAVLSITHMTMNGDRRVFDIIIADEIDQPVVAEVLIDGRSLLRWHVFRGEIVQFGTGAPVSIMRGFAGWAFANLEGDMLEAALMLQRGYLVAGARRWIVDQSPGLAITNLPELAGACYAYQPERVEQGVQSVGNVRDFTNGIIELELERTI